MVAGTSSCHTSSRIARERDRPINAATTMATMTTPAMIAMSTPCDELPCEASEDAAVESELAVAVGESAMVAEAAAPIDLASCAEPLSPMTNLSLVG